VPQAVTVSLLLAREDLAAQSDALVADVHARPYPDWSCAARTGRPGGAADRRYSARRISAGRSRAARPPGQSASTFAHSSATGAISARAHGENGGW